MATEDSNSSLPGCKHRQARYGKPINPFHESRPMRILVVEDQAKVASFIVKGLKEERYAVDLAETGAAGLELAQLNPYDLIVLDVMLPEMNGYQVCEALRQKHIKTPIMMLTARDSVADKVRGLDAGADDYLTKPFSFDEFLARLRALLRRGQHLVEPKLSAADLQLDPVSHEVTRAGKRLELTAKEYGLLEFLLRNKNRIVTRTSIIEHVWDIHFDSDTNLVDVYIRYLRRKLDDDHEVKLIHTVRGVGYVIRD